VRHGGERFVWLGQWSQYNQRTNQWSVYCWLCNQCVRQWTVQLELCGSERWWSGVLRVQPKLFRHHYPLVELFGSAWNFETWVERNGVESGIWVRGFCDGKLQPGVVPDEQY
jgi:hypothetical protein